MAIPSECPVCGSGTEPWAAAHVLERIPVSYSRCTTCGLVKADEVTWLEQAYDSAIAGLDIGLLDRCVVLSHVTAAILRAARLRQGPFLDWGGGYGTLTRLMRDRGFDFYDYELMAANVFAGEHRLTDLTDRRFQLSTAFEVLEHLVDPVRDLSELAHRTDVLLVTTQVLPTPTPMPGEWAYFALESGQHVTFYTNESIRKLSKRLGFEHCVSGSLVHVMYRGRLSFRARKLTIAHRLAYLSGLGQFVMDRRNSLLLADVAEYRRTLGSNGAT